MRLQGLRVVVTRAPHQAEDFARALQAEGADVVELPSIEIVDPDDGGVALAAAFEQIDDYDWLVATSVNTVDRIAQFLPVTTKAAAIGPATAEALSSHHVRVDLVPPQYVAESLVEVFPVGKGKVLLPRAKEAREVLPNGLREKGWSVDVVVAYKTVHASPDPDAATSLTTADVVTFTSSSTVRNFVETYGEVPKSVKVACIGPVTADTARECGLEVAVEAREHTIAGLVEALAEAELSTGR